jgi:hypothetical protein
MHAREQSIGLATPRPSESESYPTESSAGTDLITAEMVDQQRRSTEHSSEIQPSQLEILYETGNKIISDFRSLHG